jgi:hypothetical protein
MMLGQKSAASINPNFQWNLSGAGLLIKADFVMGNTKLATNGVLRYQGGGLLSLGPNE